MDVVQVDYFILGCGSLYITGGGNREVVEAKPLRRTEDAAMQRQDADVRVIGHPVTNEHPSAVSALRELLFDAISNLGGPTPTVEKVDQGDLHEK